jgi:hypothetical protein
MNDTRRFPAPSAVRHLASSTAVYEAVVKDALAVIESAWSEGTIGREAYGELLDNLQIALDPAEMGSIPTIAAACRRLLGEQV